MAAPTENFVVSIKTVKGVLPANAPSTNRQADFAAWARFFEACAGGMQPGQPGATKVEIQKGSTEAAPVQASGTVTCATVSAADTVTINGVVFTAVAGAAGAGQFSIDGTDSADATALAAAINASTNALIAGIIEASADGAVVTVKCKQKGKVGNMATLASSNGTRLAVSGARLTGGVGGDGTVRAFNF